MRGFFGKYLLFVFLMGGHQAIGKELNCQRQLSTAFENPSEIFSKKMQDLFARPYFQGSDITHLFFRETLPPNGSRTYLANAIYYTLIDGNLTQQLAVIDFATKLLSRGEELSFDSGQFLKELIQKNFYGEFLLDLQLLESLSTRSNKPISSVHSVSILVDYLLQKIRIPETRPQARKALRQIGADALPFLENRLHYLEETETKTGFVSETEFKYAARQTYNIFQTVNFFLFPSLPPTYWKEHPGEAHELILLVHQIERAREKKSLRQFWRTLRP